MFKDHIADQKGFTLQVQANSVSVPFDVTADGVGLTSRMGLGLAAETATAIGLTSALSKAVGATRSWALHDPGKVLRDIALMLADGGDALRHMMVMSGQQVLFGQIASPATACRTMKAVAENPRAMDALADARATTRARVWAAGGAPPAVAAARATERDGHDFDADGHEPLTVDLDATLIIAHSDDKDGAAKTYKRGWSHHPLNAYLDRGDGHGESLAGLLRPGNAGANNAADHITVFDLATAQLPQLPEALPRLMRADSAGASHAFLDHVVAQGWQFSTGFKITDNVRQAIRQLDDDAWVAATRQNGELREGAAVAELTTTTTSTSRAGRPAPGYWCAANRSTPARNRPSTTSTAAGSPRSCPTRPAPTSRSSTPATAATPASRTASGAARAPGCARCRATPSTATPCGSSWCSSPRTC